MNKAKLIKKAELPAQRQQAPSAHQTFTARQSVACSAQATLAQWVGAFQNSHPQNSRAAFAALFATKA